MASIFNSYHSICFKLSNYRHIFGAQLKKIDAMISLVTVLVLFGYVLYGTEDIQLF